MINQDGLDGYAAVFLVAWDLLKRRNAQALIPAGLTDQASLVDALARLDLAREVGEIDEAAYRAQRLQLKAQLLDLVHRERAA